MMNDDDDDDDDDDDYNEFVQKYWVIRALELLSRNRSELVELFSSAEETMLNIRSSTWHYFIVKDKLSLKLLLLLCHLPCNYLLYLWLCTLGVA
jgi:hypothetical protein